METPWLDINGKQISIGHIVAVRYGWNSYVGVIKLGGLYATGAERHAFFSPHSLQRTATYQILGHVNKDHSDYDPNVSEWYHKETGDCPIKLKIYDNYE